MILYTDIGDGSGLPSTNKRSFLDVIIVFEKNNPRKNAHIRDYSEYYEYDNKYTNVDYENNFVKDTYVF